MKPQGYTGGGREGAIRVTDQQEIILDKALTDDKNPEQVSEQLRASVSQEVNRIESKNKQRQDEKRASLTARQQAFVAGVVKGLTYADAYRAAYSTENSTAQTISTEANKLINNPKIAVLLEQRLQSREVVILKNKANTEAHIKQKLLEHAEGFKTESGKLKALELLGKSIGMFKDGGESGVIKQTPEDLKKQLSQHLALLDAETIKH